MTILCKGTLVLDKPTNRIGVIEEIDGFGMARVFFRGNVFEWVGTSELANAMTPEWQKLIDHRIACDEAFYPYCDAMYSDVAHWERITGLKYADER
jgi:hypothetical protein